MNFNNHYNTKLTDYGFKDIPLQKQYKSIDLPKINNNKILDKSIEHSYIDKSVNYKVNPVKKHIINDLSSIYDKYEDITRPTSLKHDSKKLNRRNLQSEILDYNQRFFNNFKVLNRKYVEEINKNLYLNKNIKSGEEEDEKEEEEFGKLNQLNVEKKKFTFQTVFNIDKFVNKLPDLCKRLSSEKLTEDLPQMKKKKVKVLRFKYESEKYRTNKSNDHRNIDQFKLKNGFSNNSTIDSKIPSKNIKLPKLSLPDLSPDKLLPVTNNNVLSIKDIVGIENAILKPFKF